VIRLLLVLLLMAAPALAQTPIDPPVRRLQVDLGGGLLGGGALGAADANLRANATTLQPYRVFSSDTRFTPSPTFHVRAGYDLTRRLGVEGGVVFSRPTVESSLANDIEGAPSLTVDERIDQYFLEGSVVFRLDEMRIGRSTVPFVAGGAGYLRQLHQGLTVIEEGHLFHLGGGLKHVLTLRNRGLVRAAGLRADARVYLLTSGYTFDDGPRPHIAASGGLFLVF
jgi:hypothetical protein